VIAPDETLHVAARDRNLCSVKNATSVPKALAHESAPDGLTIREREIAPLMADGQSNHAIAERLVISEGTVEVHVKHILGKLRFRSHSQVAGWFARQESA
jgi:DNA-binding NarL/FixJ family response regulator